MGRTSGPVAAAAIAAILAAALAAILAATLAAAPAAARVLVTRDAALASAFPGAALERRTAALDDAQAARVEELAGSAPRSRLASWYEARRDGELVGVAWLDAHVVRTKPEALLVALTPDGAVARVEVLSFDEPSDYLAPPRWITQLVGRRSGDGLRPGRDVAGLGGATLTARAMTDAVSRCLALDAVARRGVAAAGEAAP
jgi:hypothetical protein